MALPLPPSDPPPLLMARPLREELFFALVASLICIIDKKKSVV